MNSLLFIPWFRAEAIEIPFPFVGHIPIQPFGVLVAIGVILGAKIAEWKAKRDGVSLVATNDLITHVVVCGFLGGHFFDAIFYHPDRVRENPLYLFYIWNGLSSYGGFLGAVLGGLIWKVRRRQSFIAVGDPICFGFVFGWLFGRTGCFVVHDHPGIPTDFPLAVADYRVCATCPPGPPRHDLGLYEVFWSAAVIVLFLALAQKRRRRGLYFALLPTLYAPVRFFLDFLRAGADENGDLRYFGLTPGHYGSVLLFIAGVALLVRIYKLPEVDAPAPEPEPPPAKDAHATDAKKKPKKST